MSKNKYVACIDCGRVYDVEEYYDMFEAEEDCNSPCGCNVHFYKDHKDYAYCDKNEEEDKK